MVPCHGEIIPVARSTKPVTSRPLSPPFSQTRRTILFIPGIQRTSRPLFFSNLFHSTKMDLPFGPSRLFADQSANWSIVTVTIVTALLSIFLYPKGPPIKLHVHTPEPVTVSHSFPIVGYVYDLLTSGPSFFVKLT